MTSPSTRAQLNVVTLMFAFSMMNYFDRTIMSIAGPYIMKEFGLAPTQMGVIYSAFLLSYALFMMPGGQLVDWLGPKRSLTLMGFGAALFTGLTAWGGTPGLGSLLGVLPAFAVIRFLMGIATSPLYPACGRMCANWIAPVYLARVQGVIIGGSSLGGAVAPILFSTLMQRLGWRMSFAVAAAATALLALVWSLSATDLPGALPAGKAPPPAWLSLLKNRNLQLLTAAYAALGYFTYIFYYWIYFYFGEIRHLGYEQSARFTTLVFIVTGLMIPFGGWLSDKLTKTYGERFGRRAVPIGGLTLSAILLCAGTLTTGTWTTVVLVAFSMGFASFCEGPFWAMTIRLGGEQSGVACSILNTGANLAGFIAPVLTPYIASYLGWSWGLNFGCFVILLGALACWRVRLPR
ncbi:MAG: MFS transporter [Bryobacteraceae bacterium]